MTTARTVLITGTRRGIGLEVASRLAARGHTVYATVHRVESIEPTREALHQYGARVRVEKVDILNRADRMVAETWPIDVLINNAALSESGPLLEIDLNRVRRVVNTNVLGTLALTQQIVRGMLLRKMTDARVIIIGSIMGVIPTPYRAPYGMSKWALENMVHSLRTELQPFDISVVMVNPGAYATGFNAESDARAWDWVPADSPHADGMRAAAAVVARHEMHDTAGITTQIVCAVEDVHPEPRYVAPWLHWVGRDVALL